MGGQADLPDRGDPDVMAAIDLGWCMAQLYAEVKPAELQPPPPPSDGPPLTARPERHDQRIQLQADLPGVGALRNGQRLALLIDQVTVGVAKLSPRITAAGLAVPAREGWRALSQHRHSPEGRYQLARAVLEFHDDLLVALTAADRAIGLAYGLGRAVADLSLRPESRDERTFTSDFKRGGRVETISGWLTELRTALPAHAAAAVKGSMAQWQQWAAQPVWSGKPLVWASNGREVVSTLREQGTRWRLILTGQVSPLDQLSAEDYVQAAGFLVGRVRRIAQRLLAQYWPWIAGATVFMVAAVAASLVLLTSPAAKGIGVAASVFAWLAVADRSLSQPLRATVGHVEQSLWQAELDLATAWANTKLPVADSDRQLGEVRPPRLRWRR
ncbi:MAG TPA: hypothetical protein VIV12_24295 [Streptosporangiaceae bacterium]